MNAKMPFYVAINGKPAGPYSFARLRYMWSTGTINSLTLIRQEGTDWVPLGSMPDNLFLTNPEQDALAMGALARESKWVLGILGFIVFLCAIKMITSSPRPAVTQSAWDGSVRSVILYLEEAAKDPDSLQFIEWSPIERLPNGSAVRCKYRAKNSFGGYVIEDKIFVMDESGKVIGTK